jgi:hypothetical protein
MISLQEVIYSSYTPAQKKASQKYNQKPEVKENARIRQLAYYHQRKSDPEYLLKLREQAKIRYQKKKEKNLLNSL